jgi:hypothetical protein
MSVNAHKNKSAASSPRRNRCKERGKEDANNEAKPGDYGCKTGSSSLSNAGAAFDEGCDRRSSKESSNRNESCIGAVGKGRPREVAVVVANATEANHGVESGGGINNVNVQEGEEGQGELLAVTFETPI